VIRATAIRDENAQVQFAVNVFNDVTGLKRAQRAVQDLAAIVEAAEDAIVAQSLEGSVLSWNPGAERLYGYTAQEIIGGSLSILAVCFVTWMIFWMARTARGMKGELEGRLDEAITTGTWSLVVLAALAVGREGLETALFLWAAAQASDSTTDPLIGAAIGLASAVVLGVLIFRGAVRLNLSKFFTWTGGALIFVAAGVLAYGVHDLQEGGVLPGLDNLLFDVSEQIPPSSWYATLLKGTLNFTPTTTWLQAVAWTLYVIPVLTAFIYIVTRDSAAPRRATPAPIPQPHGGTA